jgi:hypothetical protein
MSATSVTGVGQGAAENNKGPHNGRDIYVPMVGPRIVRAGVSSLADGSSKSLVTVGFPPLEGDDTDYIVVATIAPVSPSAAIAAGGVCVSNFDAAAGTFVLTSADTFTHPVNWMIVKV